MKRQKNIVINVNVTAINMISLVFELYIVWKLVVRLGAMKQVVDTRG